MGCVLHLLWIDLKEFQGATKTVHVQGELGSFSCIRVCSISKDPQHFANQSPTPELKEFEEATSIHSLAFPLLQLPTLNSSQMSNNEWLSKSFEGPMHCLILRRKIYITRNTVNTLLTVLRESKFHKVF